MVTVYDKDGKPLEVYEVDAKELVAGGEYTRQAPGTPDSPQAAQASASSAKDSEEDATRRRGPGRPPTVRMAE